MPIPFYLFNLNGLRCNHGSAMKSKNSPEPIRELEFLNLSILPSGTRWRHDEESRRIVRSNAIRDANRRKKLGLLLQNNEEIPGISKSKPKPQSNFTAKFRLDQKPRTKAGHSHDAEGNGRSREISKKVEMLGRRAQRPHRSPSPGKFDPFDTLPSVIGPRARAIVQSQHSPNPMVFTFFSRERLFSCSLADPAWFNATLSLIALGHDLKVGQSISSECLFYRGEALRIVSEQLSKSSLELEIPSCTIAAIASLANFDITAGFMASAGMHVDSLVSIINSRGGLSQGIEASQQSDMLDKIVTWSDLSYGNLQNISPRLPILTSPFCTGSLHDYLEYAMSRFVKPPNVTSPHDLFGQMSSIFQSLRILSLTKDKKQITTKDQYLFSRGLYITEYKLLVILDTTANCDNYNELLPNRNSHIYGSCRLAAYMYLYMVLRELPPAAGIVRTVVRRLNLLVKAEDENLLAVWRKDMHLLLWILTMGAITRCDEEEGTYFIGAIRRVAKRMGLLSFDRFRKAIREVLWLKSPLWNMFLLDLWNRIDMGLSSIRSSPASETGSTNTNNTGLPLEELL